MRQSNGHISSVPSMLNAIRAMSSSKLFIGGLSSNVNEEALSEAFSSFGDVDDGKSYFSFNQVFLCAVMSTSD